MASTKSFEEFSLRAFITVGAVTETDRCCCGRFSDGEIGGSRNPSNFRPKPCRSSGVKVNQVRLRFRFRVQHASRTATPSPAEACKKSQARLKSLNLKTPP